MREDWIYRRGDVYLANLGPYIGAEQGGTRPVVVLQNNTGNFYGITAQLCLRPSSNLLPHPCSYKRGKYIQYSRPFITFV